MQDILYCTESENSKKNVKASFNNNNNNNNNNKNITNKNNTTSIPCPLSQFRIRVSFLHYYTELFRIANDDLLEAYFLLVFSNTCNYDNLPFLIRIICLYL